MLCSSFVPIWSGISGSLALCALCRIEITSWTPESLLSAVRKLLRDPHSFTARLCAMQTVSGDEAKGLTNFLLSASVYDAKTNGLYKRVREKEVNDCYEAFHGWLSAFYQFAAVQQEVRPTAYALTQQEHTLRRLTGQESAEPRTRAAAGGVRHAAPAPRRAAAVSSPLSAGRKVPAQGSPPPPPRTSPAGRSREQTTQPTSSIYGRSDSPGGSGTGSGSLRLRPGSTGSTSALSSVAFNASASRASPGPRVASGGGAAVHIAAGASPSVAVATVAGGNRSNNASPGLTRVQSEKTITRSPRARNASRSPSPGAGRMSPSAPPPRAARSSLPERPPGSTAGRPGAERRTLSPSQSEASLVPHGEVRRLERMASAPTSFISRSGGGAPAVEIRTAKVTAASTQSSRPQVVGQAVAVPMTRVSAAQGLVTGPGYESTARGDARRHTAPATNITVQPPSAADASGGGRRPSPPRQGGQVPRTSSPDLAAGGGVRPSQPDQGKEDDDMSDEQGSASEEEAPDGGPPRRRLSPKQYEALVRCAQQVVAFNAVGNGAPAPMPYIAEARGGQGAPALRSSAYAAQHRSSDRQRLPGRVAHADDQAVDKLDPCSATVEDDRVAMAWASRAAQLTAL
eukprot:gnl/TRDRNA2_/TRDRNA2_146724_c2_seq1.p1 gnl/TRDRNA2_/TRDRNA2_146724_c2~~gnl/TRDRNA2_/TRDRNA2_146724_c2_seq1.p1  ORF type:complete len:628 (-),score=87.59 gnl/TRDRNA2_/TRDRNA2_146724_c2_seq1:103-1986(-)